MILVLAAHALAQSSEPAALGPVELQDDVRVVYKKVYELDFDGLRVDATAEKPNGVLILEAPRPVFNPLVHLRDHFNDELAESTRQVR